MNKDILRLVGDTPLIEIKKLNKNNKVKIFAKAEWYNLSGSVKDRAALSMIEEGEKSGKLTKDKTIIESTSGNTGIALASVAKIKGYKIKLVMPESASEERKNILKDLGAELILTDPMEGIDGAYMHGKKIYEKNKDKYFKPDQYGNEGNPNAHYNGTAVEIWEQTDGKVTHFVAGTGTSGTVMGNGRKLKELNKDIRVIAAEPEEEMHGVEGLKNMRNEMVPAIYDESVVDEKNYIETEEAYDTAIRLAKEERIFVGPSSGLNIAAALRLAEKIKEGIIVTVLPDSGYRYLSRNIFPEDIFDVEVKKEDLAKIHSHAKQDYPYETCGLLIGEIKEDRKIITKIIKTENKNKVRAEDRYIIDPEEYKKIDNGLNDGESIIGVYHSHPDHPPRPSETDLNIAQPIFSYIIVSTLGDAILSTTSWILDEDEKSFKEEFLNIG